MATATPERTYTPDDLLAITDRPMPELVDGRLVRRPTVGQYTDAVATRLLTILIPFVRAHAPGLVNGPRASYQIFPDEPGKIRIPDISYTRRARVPADGPAQGHSRVAPDLVVEVVSPNDTVLELEARVDDFLAAGVPLVWVVNPQTRTVQVHRQGGSDSRLRAGDRLDGERVLPGFTVEVGRIFENLT